VFAIGWNSNEGKMVGSLSTKQENPYNISKEMFLFFAYSFLFFITA